MNKEYVIQWKSKVNGRAGRGSKPFAKGEAERIAAELNEEYPDIVHEVIPAPPPKPEEAEAGIPAAEREEIEPALAA